MINQAEGERNYHVFYELLVGMEEDELSHFFLEGLSAEDFRITSMSGTYDRRDEVNDFDTYSECKEGKIHSSARLIVFSSTVNQNHLHQCCNL